MKREVDGFYLLVEQKGQSAAERGTSWVGVENSKRTVSEFSEQSTEDAETALDREIETIQHACLRHLCIQTTFTPHTWDAVLQVCLRLKYTILRPISR